MDNQENLEWLKNCSFIKMILMLLVILGHSTALWVGWFNQEPVFSSRAIGHVSKIIGSFHIYSFILISGYIYAFSKKKYISMRSFVKNKFKRLILPYIFVSIVWVIPFHINYFNDGIKEIINSYIFGKGPSQLWFLLMLFNVFVIVTMIEKIFKIQISIIIIIFIYILGILGEHFDLNFYQVFTACKYLLYFYFGTLLYEKYLKFFLKIHSIIYIILFLLLYICKESLLLFDYGKYLNFIILNIINIGVFSSGSIMGFIVLGRIGQNIKKRETNFLKNFLYNFLEKYNFINYLFHQQIIYIIINNLNGKVSSITLVFFNFFISLILSSIIGILLRKIKITRYIFRI